MELWRRDVGADVEVERYKTLEVHSRRADVEVGVRKLSRRAVGVRDVEVLNGESALQACRRYLDRELGRRALEVRCKCSGVGCAVDVQTWRCGALEAACRRTGVLPLRGMELRSFGGEIHACRRGGMRGLEVWRSGGALRA